MTSVSYLPSSLSPESWWRELCFVTPHIAVSGDLDTSSPRALKEHLEIISAAGISVIIDVRSEESSEHLVKRLRPEITYHHLPTADDGGRRPHAWFSAGTNAATAALRDHRKVLVHCHMGVNRAPSLAFAVMLATGHSPISALDAIRSTRPIAAIAYALDALSWWHQSSNTPDNIATSDRAAVGEWFRANPIDERRIISAISKAYFAREIRVGRGPR